LRNWNTNKPNKPVHSHDFENVQLFQSCIFPENGNWLRGFSGLKKTCHQEVTGSNPVGRTKYFKGLAGGPDIIPGATCRILIDEGHPLPDKQNIGLNPRHGGLVTI